MDAKDFQSLAKAYAASLTSQAEAQAVHRGQGPALRERAVCVAELSIARARLAAAEAEFDATGLATDALVLAKGAVEKAEAAVNDPECCAALASKTTLAEAEKAHGENAAALREIMAQRPAAIVGGAVVAYATVNAILAALDDGAALLIPDAWPELFPQAAILLYADGVVSVDPVWAKAAKVAELEKELALLELRAARPDEIRAQLTELRKG